MAAVHTSRNQLKLDLSALLSGMKLALLKETEKLNIITRSKGVNISEHLDTIFNELLESIDEYSDELKEVIKKECAINRVKLVDMCDLTI